MIFDYIDIAGDIVHIAYKNDLLPSEPFVLVSCSGNLLLYDLIANHVAWIKVKAMYICYFNGYANSGNRQDLTQEFFAVM